MKAAFLSEPGTIYIEDIPKPACGPDQVLIQIKAAGLCGSDLHYFREGRIGDHIIREPHILGHESAGIIAEVGDRVQGFVPGDRVAVEPGVPCLACELCLNGNYNLCSDVQFMGAPPYPGTFREFLVHDPKFVFKLPDSVSLDQGALMEPVSVAYNALLKADAGGGKSLLIIGAGPIGLACLEMARALGAAPVIVSEPDGYRREVVLKMGADMAIDPRNEDLVDSVNRATGGAFCDSVIEASGADEEIVNAVLALKKGGSVALVGMGKEITSFPLLQVLKKEATIRGIYRYANFYRPVLSMLEAGSINGETWVSHRFNLEDIEEAIRVAEDPNADSLKMIITMGDEG